MLGRVTKSYIGKLKKKFIGKNVSAVLIETRQGRFLVDPEDCGVSRQLIRHQSYGQKEIIRLLDRVNRKSRVLFVGAHIGALVIPVAKLVKEVIAIEANPVTFELFKANIVLNNLDNITPYSFAASNKKQIIEFVMSKANSGGSKIMPKIAAVDYFFDKPKTTQVQACRLDDLIKEKSFDLIFMDIEGSEYFALQGMGELLKNAKTLVIEFLPHHLKNVSGASVEQFLDLIEPYFNQLIIPSKNESIMKNDFLKKLQSMYESNQGDEGVIFLK